MKKLILAVLTLVATISAFAQSSSVEQDLKSKFSLVQHHPEYGGWYFLSSQEDGHTLYGFADAKGNVVASGATKYKLHKAYIEFYLVRQEQKALHDQWILEMKQHTVDTQNYQKVEKAYENELKVYQANCASAHAEAERRWNVDIAAAVKRAERENQINQQKQQQSSSVGLAILSGVLSGTAAAMNIANAKNIPFDPYYDQVLGERGLVSEPSKPYNPKPIEPIEPPTGYYWGRYLLAQPSPYDYIDFDAIAEVDNFANVKKNGKFGLVDSYLKEVIPCEYNVEILRKKLSSTHFMIFKNAKFGVIDNTGKSILPCDYNSIELFEGKYKVKKESSYGLYSLQGVAIMPCEFEVIKPSNGYLLCCKNDLWGIYTDDFDELYPCQFQDQKFVTIDGKPKLFTQVKGLWGVIDFETGKSLLPNNYSNIDMLDSFDDERFYKVEQNGKVGLYNQEGVIILPCDFTNIEFVKMKNNEYYTSAITVNVDKAIGVYTMNGVQVIDPLKYDACTYMGNYYQVFQGDLLGICDNYGHEVVPCKYDKLEFDSQLKGFVAYRSGLCGVVSLEGEELFPFVNASIISYKQDRPDYFKLYDSKEDKYGAVDFSGQVIVPIKYNTVSVGKKVAKYCKKHDITTVRKEKLNLLQADLNDMFKDVNLTFSKYGSFSFFAQHYVERIINEWQKRGEYEKLDEWQKRVNNDTRQQMIFELTKHAQNTYVKKMSSALEKDNIKIEGAYDPDNETYCLSTSYAKDNILVNVPTNDAQEFKTTFETIDKKASFFVENDRIGLAEYAFYLPNGNVYKYNNQASLSHSIAQVDYNFDAIVIDKSASNNNYQKGKQTISTTNFVYGSSDVDINIPISDVTQDKTFAVIIANETYENEKNVELAYNDGQVFRDYCIKTLGIPEQNVHFRANATLNNMRFEINWLKNVAKAYNGEAKFIVYYAGHGMPDENSKDAYLLPIDGYSSDAVTGYKLAELYESLNNVPSVQTVLFLDACFSGSQRSGDVMASARGVAIAPKMSLPKGNVITFSASSDVETAYPYAEKSHGLFTYFLLKKLQESKGNICMGELSDYVKSNVSKVSIVNNNKSQTPTLVVSENFDATWRDISIK